MNTALLMLHTALAKKTNSHVSVDDNKDDPPKNEAESIELDKAKQIKDRFFSLFDFLNNLGEGRFKINSRSLKELFNSNALSCETKFSPLHTVFGMEKISSVMYGYPVRLHLPYEGSIYYVPSCLKLCLIGSDSLTLDLSKEWDHPHSIVDWLVANGVYEEKCEDEEEEEEEEDEGENWEEDDEDDEDWEEEWRRAGLGN